jgi:hypothetical protein
VSRKKRPTGAPPQDRAGGYRARSAFETLDRVERRDDAQRHPDVPGTKAGKGE